MASRSALALGTSSQFTTIVSNANGGFTQSSVSSLFGAGILGIAMGDINNDGKMDVVISTSSGGGRLITYSGAGNGSLTAGTSSGVVSNSPFAQGLKLADMNNDGKLDALLFDSATNTINIVGSAGTGWNSTYTSIAGAVTLVDYQMGDFNSDGFMDIAMLDGTSVKMYKGTGVGTYAAATTIVNSVVNGYQLLAGDFNRDGRKDLIMGGFDGTDVTFNVGLNAMMTGQEGYIRVSNGGANAANVGYRMASIYLDSLDEQLGYSMIGSLGAAKRAEDSLKRAMNNLNLYRTNVGAAVNRLEKVIDNIATMYENQDSARSAYMDLDVAAEMTLYTAKQIAVQAGISMLTQANQTQQSLLKLLA
jgi:flagellin-like hook-associated protein FlgL